MSLNARERLELDAIEEELAAADTHLAAMMRVFSRLADGESMPSDDRVRAVSHEPRAQAAGGTRARQPRKRSAAGRISRRLGRERTFLVVWLAMAIVLIGVAAAAIHAGDSATCPARHGVACQGNLHGVVQRSRPVGG